MSLPLEQQQVLPPPPPPPPPPAVAYGQSHGSGSVGPVIAVLAVIAVLGVLAGIVGRLCSGRRVFGYGHYDCEGWIERRCASCIDGTTEALPPQPVAPRRSANGGAGGPGTPPPEAKRPSQDPAETSGS